MNDKPRSRFATSHAVCAWSSRIGATLAVSALAGGLGVQSAFAITPESAPTAAVTLAQNGESVDPASISSRLVDTANILSPSEKQAIGEKQTELQQNEGKVLFIVITDEIAGTAEEFTNEVVRSRGPNSAVYVLSVNDRKMGVQVGAEWDERTLNAMNDAAAKELSTDNFAQSAEAVASAALGNSGGASDGGAWLAAGGLGAVAAGGGIWAYTRRNSKKRADEDLSNARAIDPRDTNSLANLDTQTLDSLAQEEIVSTDESIRRGKEELAIAQQEFGAERTRPFTRAMNQSTKTMSRAYNLRTQIDSAGAASESQRRSMLIDIISSCGQADDALDEQAQKFAEMRNLLFHADKKLSELTQATVDLRSRLPEAKRTLESLHAEYPEEKLQSVADNADMAKASLDEAEKSLSAARAYADKPAGQQGEIVTHIRDCEHAIEVADRLLRGIENARTNIADAKAGLSPLIDEVEEELREAAQLKEKGTSQGTKADWDSLDAVVNGAREALERAKQEGESDPLGAYNGLLSADTELDQRLDSVREKTSTHSRQLMLFEQQINAAGSTIQAAEDLISSRGRIVGSGARTALADAQRLHAQALNSRDSDIRSALNFARESANAAQVALQRAQDDFNNYRRSQQRQQAASSAGNIITGIVIGQVLGGGGRGFGGGFGGGHGFGGGGGGFSGGFRGGSF